VKQRREIDPENFAVIRLDSAILKNSSIWIPRVVAISFGRLHERVEGQAIEWFESPCDVVFLLRDRVHDQTLFPLPPLRRAASATTLYSAWLNHFRLLIPSRNANRL